MKKNFKYRFGKFEYDLNSRTYIMGILNVTPDSFSDGGKFYETNKAIEQGIKIAEEGADFIDIGGESTRPGSESISADEEIKRVVPIIEALSKKISIPISIDTYKASVAEKALQAGAVIVNDISAMTFDEQMPDIVAKYNAGVILMHIKDKPKTMQVNPSYENVTREVKDFLKDRVEKTKLSGINQIIIDPGIGFGKKLEHNLQLIRELKSFVELECPILIGASRKSFIGTILDLPPNERLEGTAAIVTASILNGANIVRVHDVKEIKRVAMVTDALRLRTIEE